MVTGSIWQDYPVPSPGQFNSESRRLSLANPNSTTMVLRSLAPQHIIPHFLIPDLESANTEKLLSTPQVPAQPGSGSWEME